LVGFGGFWLGASGFGLGFGSFLAGFWLGFDQILTKI